MIISIINYVALFFSLGFLLYSYYRYLRGSRRAALVDEIPGPKALPFLGNNWLFSGSTEDIFYTLLEVNKDYYPIHRLWNFTMPVVTLMHPDDAQALLSSVKHIDKSNFYDFLRPWLGTGLLTSTGYKWQTRRKILTPSFHFAMLQRYALIFEKRGKRLAKSLKTRKGAFVEDIVPLLSKHTLNLICETAMGISLDETDTLGNRYRNSVNLMGEIIVHRLLRPWVYKDCSFYLTPKGQTQAKALKVLHGFTNKVIGKRIQYHESLAGEQSRSTISSDANLDFESEEKDFKVDKKKMAMLDLLISVWRKDGGIDHTGIREEVDTFMFEGHDTTAMALCYSLLCLAEHSSIQDRCRREIDAVFQESDDKLGIPELQKLSYLEQCIKESLRLFPSVPLISRNIREDLHLKDHVVPAGTTVQLHIFSLHRDPNFWKNPDVFDPDRFLPDRLVGSHPFAYLPFSGGPRNCIGQKFAIYELKALIAYLIHDFFLEPVDFINDIRFLQGLILHPSKPIRVKFIPRF